MRMKDFNRQVAVVQGNIIEKFKDANIGKRAQLSIRESTPHAHPNIGILRLYVLRTTKSAVEITWKRHRNANEQRFYFAQTPVENGECKCINKGLFLVQMRVQFIKGVGALSQAFCVATKSEIFIHTFDDKI